MRGTNAEIQMTTHYITESMFGKIALAISNCRHETSVLKGTDSSKILHPPPSISIPNFQNLNRCVCVGGGGVSCTYNFNFNVNLVNFTWGPFITQFKKKVCWEKRRVSGGGGGGLPPLMLLACIAICLCWAKLINLDAKFTIWHATFFFLVSFLPTCFFM